MKNNLLSFDMPKIPRLLLPLAIAALLCTTAQAQTKKFGGLL